MHAYCKNTKNLYFIKSYICTYIHSGTAPIINGVTTVIINGLMCEMEYTIVAGGTLDGVLVGPRSSHGIVTAGPCPPIAVTTTATITSVTVIGKEHSYIETEHLVMCNFPFIALIFISLHFCTT